MYAGPATLQSLERQDRLTYLARYSIEWKPGTSIHHAAKIMVGSHGAVIGVEVVDERSR